MAGVHDATPARGIGRRSDGVEAAAGAGAVQGQADEQSPSSTSWSCIVFATRKLAVAALDALFRAAGPPAAFLRSAPFMGFSGVSGTRMDIRVPPPHPPRPCIPYPACGPDRGQLHFP